MTLKKCKGGVSAAAKNTGDLKLKRRSCDNLTIFQQIIPLISLIEKRIIREVSRK